MIERASIPVGAQLYTVREQAEQDLPGSLAAVAGLGYRALEWFGGSFGRRTAELRRQLDDLGLEVLAAHVAIEELETGLERAVERTAALGCRHLVCPWLCEERRSRPGAFEEVGRSLDRVGARLREQGFTLAYHNHDFELTEAKEPDGLRRILASSSPENLALELDVYWLAYGGVDPAATIRELGDRVRFLHLKDGRLDRVGFAPLGRGEIDLGSVLGAAREVGVEALFVEQDHCVGSPLEALAASLAHLRALGVG